MRQLSLPNYVEISQAVSKTKLKLHPSQAHGVICGILCGAPNSHASWDELVTGGKETGEVHQVLQDLHDVSEKQLKDFLFEFQLVLPPDTDSLSERAEALTLWCQGFLTGLEMVGVKLVGRKPSDVTEAIDDLLEVSKINYEDVIENDEDESAYIELVEYVRMAVILVNRSLHETNTSTNSQLH